MYVYILYLIIFIHKIYFTIFKYYYSSHFVHLRNTTQEIFLNIPLFFFKFVFWFHWHLLNIRGGMNKNANYKAHITFCHLSCIVSHNSLLSKSDFRYFSYMWINNEKKKRNKVLTLQMVVFLNYMDSSLETTNWSCLTSDSTFSKINKCSHFSYLIRDFMCKSDQMYHLF